MRPVYEEISRQAIFTVRASDVARSLGKRLSPEAEVTSDFHTRVEGTRIKHQLNRQAIIDLRVNNGYDISYSKSVRI